MPDAGKVTSQDGKIALNTTTLDLTWAYDPIGDFPAVFNIPAITNFDSRRDTAKYRNRRAGHRAVARQQPRDIGLNLVCSSSRLTSPISSPRSRPPDGRRAGVLF